MSEPTVPPVPPKSIDPSQATTQISYCPHLDIYNFKRVDGEYFFDTPALEASIETYQTTGDLRQADFMAALTSFARKFPHKVITIFPDLTFEIRKLSPRKFSVDGEDGEKGEDGMDGEKGKDGMDGEKGKDGMDGEKSEDGEKEKTEDEELGGSEKPEEPSR